MCVCFFARADTQPPLTRSPLFLCRRTCRARFFDPDIFLRALQNGATLSAPADTVDFSFLSAGVEADGVLTRLWLEGASVIMNDRDPLSFAGAGVASGRFIRLSPRGAVICVDTADTSARLRLYSDAQRSAQRRIDARASEIADARLALEAARLTVRLLCIFFCEWRYFFLQKKKPHHQPVAGSPRRQAARSPLGLDALAGAQQRASALGSQQCEDVHNVRYCAIYLFLFYLFICFFCSAGALPALLVVVPWTRSLSAALGSA